MTVGGRRVNRAFIILRVFLFVVPTRARTYWAQAGASSLKLREILFPEFGFDAFAGGAALGLGGTQLDPADLARDRLRQLGEFEPAHPLERRQARPHVPE